MEANDLRPLNLRSVVLQRLSAMLYELNLITDVPPSVRYSEEVVDCLSELRLSLSRAFYSVSSPVNFDLDDVHESDSVK